MFTDRHQAGQELLERLGPLDPENTVVLALPRGGLPVADVIADAIGTLHRPCGTAGTSV